MTRSAHAPHRQPLPPGPGQVPDPQIRGERRLISPFRCRVWTQHSRPEEQLTEHALKSLRESVDRNGQHQPALGRPVTDDPDYDVEIICGARRHAAALALGRELIVELRTLTDAQAYVAMYEENVEREGDCPYIQGQILRRALHSGACSSQEELARAFGISHSRVSRLLMIAQLPSIVVAAFEAPQDIRESWGVHLYQLWKSKDPPHPVAERARSIASREPRPPARQIYEYLIAPSGGRIGQRRLARSTPVHGRDGNILFQEQDRLESVTFIVPKTLLTKSGRDLLRQAIISALQPPSAAIPGQSDRTTVPANGASRTTRA